MDVFNVIGSEAEDGEVYDELKWSGLIRKRSKAEANSAAYLFLYEFRFSPIFGKLVHPRDWIIRHEGQLYLNRRET